MCGTIRLAQLNQEEDTHNRDKHSLAQVLPALPPPQPPPQRRLPVVRLPPQVQRQQHNKIVWQMYWE